MCFTIAGAALQGSKNSSKDFLINLPLELRKRQSFCSWAVRRVRRVFYLKLIHNPVRICILSVIIKWCLRWACNPAANHPHSQTHFWPGVVAILGVIPSETSSHVLLPFLCPTRNAMGYSSVETHLLIQANSTAVRSNKASISINCMIKFEARQCPHQLPTKTFQYLVHRKPALLFLWCSKISEHCSTC